MEILLRPITIDDTEDVLSFRNAPHVRENFIYRATVTKEEHLKRLKNIERGSLLQYMIVDADTNKSIGSAFLTDIDRVHQKAELGIFIGDSNYLSPSRGGGGQRSIEKLLKIAFKDEKLHKIYLRVLPENKRAIRCYENVGFKTEGYLKDSVLIEGKYHDIMLMAIIAPD
ncbi:MAG: UDP-4-amino-4,6-dideoxy-N-acetyl-beta-L-altrosamine N-acetyltransferase [Selenomonadaceae bacterium]|nr:UDP-4-amino-4,6-dideoxy-N-acetyl-beta-L-altrosamine N-acetyltransferase [Selenomonadaceae bacterium]